MKSWQKGFLGGVLLGGIGAVPLVWWASSLKVSFHCPNCDATLAIKKSARQVAPRISIQDDVPEDDTPSDGIAVAPTV